jgi:hypothetical protein
MARRILAGGGLALALAVVLGAPAAEAQGSRNWNRSGTPAGSLAAPPPPPPAQAGPPVRSTPQLPNYYLERRGPVATPRATTSPGDVAASLRARGFRDIGPVQQRGNTAIVPHATGPSGEKVQLVIGPNGEILGVRVLGLGGR